VNDNATIRRKQKIIPLGGERVKKKHTMVARRASRSAGKKKTTNRVEERRRARKERGDMWNTPF